MDMPRRKAGLIAGLSVATAAILITAALIARAAGVFGCFDGPATPSLTLMPFYAQTHPEITSIRLCVRGGGCASGRMVAIGTWRNGRTRGRYLKALEFGRLIPASVAGMGADGGDIHLTVTAFDRAGPVLSASATLGPLRRAPASQCLLRGYTIIAQLTQDETLTYLPVV